MKELIKISIIRTIPVMAGYLALGFGFGILMETNGYSVWYSLAMSLFIYAGSMQFVAIGLLTSGASLITAAVTTLMVNARHLFYGISMVEPYKNTGKKKFYLIFSLTDETYALVCAGGYPEGINPHQYSLCVSLLNHIYWVTGSVLGSLIGALISFNSTGIDFAMTALFITVVVDQWKNTSNHLPALSGITASLVCLLLFGAESFLIPSMMLIIAVLIIGRKTVENKGGF